MPGDRPEPYKSAQPQQEEHSLFSSAFEKIKHGATAVKDTTIGVVKKGVEKGEELASHPTTKKIAGDIADAGKHALHKGQEIARDPNTQRIAGQVMGAGREVARDHVNQVNGVIDAGKRGDVNGVIRHGLPLAGEAMLGPGAAAALIAKEKGAKILMENVPPEHRETVQKIKGATDLVTTKPSTAHLPNLIIENAARSGKY